jgi:hypothetical protein
MRRDRLVAGSSALSEDPCDVARPEDPANHRAGHYACERRCPRNGSLGPGSARAIRNERLLIDRDPSQSGQRFISAGGFLSVGRHGPRCHRLDERAWEACFTSGLSKREFRNTISFDDMNSK